VEPKLVLWSAAVTVPTMEIDLDGSRTSAERVAALQCLPWEELLLLLRSPQPVWVFVRVSAVGALAEP
jgi:hypothetical protein